MIQKIIIDDSLEIVVDSSTTFPIEHTFTTPGNHNVKYVTEDGIIPSKAFLGCKNLKSAVLNSITEIKDNAFSGSGINSLNIPKEVTKIDASAVEGCVSTLTFEGSVPPQVTGSFNTNIDIYVPKLVDETYRNTLVGANIISNNDCVIQIRTNSLYILNYHKNNIESSKHKVYGADEWIDDDLETSVPANSPTGDYVYLWTLKSAVLPDSWLHNAGYSGTHQYKEIDIISGITTIGRFTFQNVGGLTRLNLGNSVTTIDYAGVSACKSLTTIQGGANVTTIDKFAFFSLEKITDLVYMGTRLAYFPESIETDVTIQEGVEEVTLSWGCKAASITLPSTCKYLSAHTSRAIPITMNEGLEEIEVYNQGTLDQTFPSTLTKLNSWTINRQITHVPENVVEATNMHVSTRQTSVLKNAKVLFDVPITTTGVYNIPEGIEFVCGWCFNSSNVTEVIIPNSVKTWEGSFAYSKILKVVFPNSITNYVMGATFQQCTDLQEVDFGTGFKECTGQMFGYCTSLNKVTFRNTDGVVPIGNYYGSAVYQWGDHKITNLYVPAELVSAYKASSWNRYATNILPIQ